MKTKKGNYGYAKVRSLQQLIYTLICLTASACVYFLGYFLTKNSINLLSIVAILGMLPTSKLIVSSVMALKAKKFACTDTLYNEIKETWDVSQNSLCAFDLYLTSNDKNYPIPFITVKKGCMIGLIQSKKQNGTEAAEHIQTYLKKNSISGIVVKIYDSEDKLIERLKQLSSSEENDFTENEQKALNMAKSLSL